MTDTEYSITEVAKLFFDVDSDRFRWLERKGVIVHEDGSSIGSRKDNKRGANLKQMGQTKKVRGDRVYTLDDVAAIADALRRAGALDAPNHKAVMRRVDAHRVSVIVAGAHRIAG